MSDQVMNGVIATVLGIGLAVLLLAPTAAYQYRRDGRLGFGDLLTLVAAAVYGLALWTYTLLPFPVDDTFTCSRRQLRVLGSFRPVLDQGIVAPSELVHDVAFLQLALNVLLFVPLGFFVRLVLRRGVVVTTLLGFGISLAIELTQLTGVWGLYHCAYRVFDVDDLLVNTLGALAGGLLAWVLLRRRRREAAALPTRITLGRRWVGFVCDAVVVVVAGAAAAIAWRAWQLYGQGVAFDEIDDRVTVALQVAVPLALQGASVLLGGRTAGEWAISVRTAGGRGLVLRRLVKLVLGVGALAVLIPLDVPFGGLLLTTLVVATLVASARSRGHRGLTGWAAGLELEIDQPGSG